MDDIPQYQHYIDEFCSQMILSSSYLDPNKLRVNLILNWRPSRVFWKQWFRRMFGQARYWENVSNCPVEIARDNATDEKLIPTICESIKWDDIYDKDEPVTKFEWDLLYLFNRIQENPKGHRNVIANIVHILQRYLRTNTTDPKELLKYALKDHIKITPKMAQFIHGYMDYHYSDVKEVSLMGYEMLKYVPEYSQYVDLPADKYRSDMTQKELVNARVDVDFVNAYYAQHKQIKREWFKYLKITSEALNQWKDCDIDTRDINDFIIPNLDGSILREGIPALWYEILKANNLYQYLSRCKNGLIDKEQMDLLYTNYIQNNQILHGLQPSMMEAILKGEEPNVLNTQ